MNYKQLFKDFDKLTRFEKIILKTCTYLPPKEKKADSNLYNYHPLSWYVNKMTVHRAKKIASRANSSDLIKFETHMIYNCSWLKFIPVLNEFFCHGPVSV